VGISWLDIARSSLVEYDGNLQVAERATVLPLRRFGNQGVAPRREPE